MRTRLIPPVLAVICSALPGFAQTTLNWEQVKARFETANPTLQAGQLSIAESKTLETTAFLRPNPNMTVSADQFDPFSGNPYRPFGSMMPYVAFDYLHERQHKRELRLDSAQKATSIAESQQLDLERTMLFTLRNAFVQTLQAKQLLLQAQANLDYYGKELAIFRTRFQSGAIARVDLDRMLGLEEFHTVAEAARPDLKAAVQAIEKAQTDHKLAVANGSVDPTFGVDFARNPPIPLYMGFSVSIPLRIFDRNQGEKARTEIDIAHAGRLKDAAPALVFSDVDSAYFTLISSASLLKPYQGADGYLATATRVRDTMSFSYQRGAASLVDYLDAQRDYRATEVAYINLVAAYMTAAGQLNLAVGREVVP